MTGQSLLNMMEVVDNELQAQSGEDDVTRSLIALNIAQDQFEAIVSQFPDLLGGATGTIVSVANTETTAFPTDVLRIDKLQLLDATTARPAYTLNPTFEAGSHVANNFWPWNQFVTSSTGKPRSFWTNGANIFWNPIPSSVDSFRWYGFQTASDITASGTFAYKDIVAFPLAAFAAKLMSMGVGDDVGDLSAEANRAFGATISSLSRFNRTGAAPLNYSEAHLA